MDDIETIARGLTKAQREDLTSNWDAACDGDWALVTTEASDFFESQEAAGFADLVPVDDDALEDAFAAERGIEKGGSMWRLTPLGLRVRAYLEEQNNAS